MYCKCFIVLKLILLHFEDIKYQSNTTHIQCCVIGDSDNIVLLKHIKKIQNYKMIQLKESIFTSKQHNLGPSIFFLAFLVFLVSNNSKKNSKN